MYVTNDPLEKQVTKNNSRKIAQSTDDMLRDMGIDPGGEEAPQQQRPMGGSPTPAPAPEGGPSLGPQEGVGEFVEGVVKTPGRAAQELVNAMGALANLSKDPSIQVGKIPRIQLVDDPDTQSEKIGSAVGDMAIAASSFGAGTLMATTKTGKAVAGAAASFAADFALFDPREERLSNLVADNVELLQPVAEFLAHDDDSPELEERFKNAVEGVVIGGAADSVITAVKTYKALRKFRGVPDAPDIDTDVIKNAPEINVDTRGVPDSGPIIQRDPVPSDPSVAQRMRDEKIISLQRQLDEAEAAKDVEKATVLRKQVEYAKSTAAPVGKPKIETVQDLERIGEELAGVGEVGGYKDIDEMMRAVNTTHHIDDMTKDAVRMAYDKKAMAALYKRGTKGFNAVEARAMMIDGKSEMIRVKTAVAKFFGENASGILTDAAAIRAKKFELVQNFKNAAMKFELGRSVALGEHGRSMRLMQETPQYYSPSTVKNMAKDMYKMLGTEDEITEGLRGLMFLDSEGLSHAATLSKKVRFVEAIKEGVKISLTSGINTSIRNLISGVTQLAIRPVDLAMARMFARMAKDPQAVSELDARLARNLQETVRAGAVQTTAHLKGLVAATVQASLIATRSVARGSFRKDYVKFVDRYTIAANERLHVRKTFLKPQDPDTPIGAVLDFGGAAVRSLGMGLAATDTYLDAIAVSVAKHEGAFGIAARNGLQGKEYAEYADKLMAAPLSETKMRMGTKFETQFDRDVMELHSAADKYAQEVKLLGDPSSTLGKEFVDTIQNFGKGTFGVGTLDFLMPFSRVAVNIAEGAYDRTFLNLLHKSTRDALERGGPEAAMIKGKIATGTALISLGVYMAANGNLTGSLMGSRENEQSLREKGILPNSVVRNGKSMSIEGMGVQALVLQAAADLYKIAEYAYKTGVAEQDWFAPAYSELSYALAATVANNLMPNDILRTMGELVGLAADPMSASTRETGATSNLISSALVPAAIKDIEKIVDPIARYTGVQNNSPFAGLQVMKNKILSRIPGLSSTLPPMVDTLGYDMRERSGVLSSTIEIIDNGSVQNKAAEVLIDLGMAGPLVSANGRPHLILRKPTDKITKIVHGVASATYNLTPEQYYVYLKLAAGIPYKVTKSSDGQVKFEFKKDAQGELEKFIIKEAKSEPNRLRLSAKIKKKHSGLKEQALITLYGEYKDVMDSQQDKLDTIVDSFNEKD